MPAAPLRQIAARLRTLPEEAVRVGADAANVKIIERVRQDTGGDQQLSGTGTKGRKKLATTTRVSGGVSIGTANIAASPARGKAQWSWLERGTQPHTVGRRRDGKGGLHMTPGAGWKTGPFRVAGSPAKRTWSEGARAGVEAARTAMLGVVRTVLR